MDQQGDAQEDQNVEESTQELKPYSDDSASDKDGDDVVAAEPEDDIVDETVTPGPKKMRTRSNTRKVYKIPESVICSDRLTLRTRNLAHGSASVLMPTRPRYERAVTPKYFSRNSNQLPSIASKKLAARKARAGSRGRK